MAVGRTQLASLPRTIAYLVLGLFASKARRTSLPKSSGKYPPSASFPA